MRNNKKISSFKSKSKSFRKILRNQRVSWDLFQVWWTKSQAFESSKRLSIWLIQLKINHLIPYFHERSFSDLINTHFQMKTWLNLTISMNVYNKNFKHNSLKDSKKRKMNENEFEKKARLKWDEWPNLQWSVQN